MRTKHNYIVNEVYRSLQGEGIRVGSANVFVRFTGCNLRCDMNPGAKSPGGFWCDTEFESGRQFTTEQLVRWIKEEDGNDPCKWVVLTGGEPGLQVDTALIESLHNNGYSIAIETNGTVVLPAGIDWVTVSPKVAEHCIRQLSANEVKYVRGYGQALPKTRVAAKHYMISPAFMGLEIDERAMEWCKELVKETQWNLMLQQHKIAGIR